MLYYDYLHFQAVVQQTYLKAKWATVKFYVGYFVMLPTHNLFKLIIFQNTMKENMFRF